MRRDHKDREVGHIIDESIQGVRDPQRQRHQCRAPGSLEQRQDAGHCQRHAGPAPLFQDQPAHDLITNRVGSPGVDHQGALETDTQHPIEELAQCHPGAFVQRRPAQR